MPCNWKHIWQRARRRSRESFDFLLEAGMVTKYSNNHSTLLQIMLWPGHVSKGVNFFIIEHLKRNLRCDGDVLRFHVFAIFWLFLDNLAANGYSLGFELLKWGRSPLGVILLITEWWGLQLPIMWTEMRGLPLIPSSVTCKTRSTSPSSSTALTSTLIMS